MQKIGGSGFSGSRITVNCGKFFIPKSTEVTTHLIFHVKIWLDVLLVESQRCDGSQFVVFLALIVVLPHKLAWRRANADAAQSVNLHVRQNTTRHLHRQTLHEMTSINSI